MPVARKTQSGGHLPAEGSALVTEKRVKTTTTTNTEGERGSFIFFQAEKKRARAKRVMALQEGEEREEAGSAEGTAHMLSHCF